mmetsp:Transcript_821/g.1745  ORF Transcript_821/g.1745 Transcript_821/m.1745 type:complete len:376 (-) Transcript_821:359-1486(-)
MTCECKNATSTIFNQDISGLTKCTSGINHIVNKNAITVLNVSYKVHGVNKSSTCSLFHNHGQSNILHIVLVHKTLLEFFRSVYTTSIGTDDDGVVQILRSKVIQTNDSTIQVIHRYSRTEESLDLTAVQIDSDDTVYSHCFNQTGNIGCRNWNTSLHLSVLSSVSVVWNNNSDSAGTSSSQSRNHEQQLHNIVVHRWASRLDHIAILTTNVFVYDHIGLTVGESADSSLSEIDTKMTADFQGEGQITISTEEFESTGVLLGLFGRLLNFPFLCSHFRDSISSSSDCYFLFLQLGIFSLFRGTRCLYLAFGGFAFQAVLIGSWVRLRIHHIAFLQGWSAVTSSNCPGTQEGGTRESCRSSPRFFVGFFTCLLPGRS